MEKSKTDKSTCNFGEISNISLSSGICRLVGGTDPSYVKITDKKQDERKRTSFNNGKNIYLSAKNGAVGVLYLAEEKINQGAGALYFDGDFLVTGKNENITWQGAGVSVAKDKKVIWRVHNPEGDRLSKIGEGTLYVDGKGENKGDISVGDGVVVLAQRADESGKKQAFNQLGIVSGRPTVVLQDADQVDPNKIYFGFRGGRLDLNGNDLTFSYIQNTDSGARIVNHNLEKTANVTITNLPELKERELKVNDRVHQNQHVYSRNNRSQTKDYFLPKPNRFFSYATYPMNQQSNGDWEYIGSDEIAARKIVAERLNKERLISAFNGYLGEIDPTRPNGKLNLTFSPESNEHLLFITGGLNLNGDVNVKQGNLLLSGRLTPHAYDHLKREDVIRDDDWINRSFYANNINVENGNLYIGRNVSNVKANFTAANQSSLSLGFIDNETPVCVRSDYSGKVLSCDKESYEYVEVLGRYKNERATHYIRKDYINEPYGFDKWKVVLPKANGSGSLGETLSSPIVCKPLLGFTQTFISIGTFSTQHEAENALKYIKSKFARTMLGILKITQDNPRDKWKKVPIQDFTKNSDIDRNKSISEIDNQLYMKYGLDESEINFIETRIKEM